MIAIAVDVRLLPSASSAPLSRLAMRLRFHTHVDVGEDRMIVDLPNIGHALVTEHDDSLVIDSVVEDELGVKRFAVALLALLDDAAGDRDFRDSLRLEWSRPSSVPVPLR